MSKPTETYPCWSSYLGRRLLEMSKSNSKGEGMKQKSLMSFFGKADTGSTLAKAKTNAKTTSANSSKKSAVKAIDLEEQSGSLHTPKGKGASQSSGISSAKYSRSSDGGSSAIETPPTSDAIDVDMSSEVDEEFDEAVRCFVTEQCYELTVC